MMPSYTVMSGITIWGLSKHSLKKKKTKKLSEANLRINLAKNEFCHATLTFLGQVVGIKVRLNL